MIATLTRMPAWARWALYAALGVFLLTVVQTISDTERLTQVATAREMLRFAVPIFHAIPSITRAPTQRRTSRKTRDCSNSVPRPSAIRNSMTPNCKPFRTCSMISKDDTIR